MAFEVQAFIMIAWINRFPVDHILEMTCTILEAAHHLRAPVVPVTVPLTYGFAKAMEPALSVRLKI